MAEQLDELVRSREPTLLRDGLATGRHIDALLDESPPELFGRWVFYPWSVWLVHVLPELLHRELRLDRNRYKITAADQTKVLFRKRARAGRYGDQRPRADRRRAVRPRTVSRCPGSPAGDVDWAAVCYAGAEISTTDVISARLSWHDIAALLRFPQAVRKHKTGKSRVRHVIANPLLVFRISAPDDHSDHRILYLKEDETGRALEVLTVPMEDGELVIHAMDLRTKYRLLCDSRGNLIDSDYIDKVNHEAEVGYDLGDLAPARIGRPSLSEAGDSPQVRFRLPAATRAEAAALAAREGKTLSQLGRDAVEAYLIAHRSA